MAEVVEAEVTAGGETGRCSAKMYPPMYVFQQ